MPDATPTLVVSAMPSGAAADGNPYVSSLYRHLRDLGVRVDGFDRHSVRRGGYDVLHLHWPEHLLGGRFGATRRAREAVVVLGTLWIARHRGARVVWTVHNLRSHDEPVLSVRNVYLRLFSHLVDRVISLSAAAVPEIRAAYPALRRVPVDVVPHGDYLDAYPAPGSRSAARRKLGFGDAERVLLQLGQVRRYKNVVEVVRAFRQVPGPTRLVVAGRVADDSLEQEIRQAAGEDEAVDLRLHHVSAAEVSLLHAAADVVVLPYRDGALNSGAAILSLSLGRAVVCRDTPTMRELAGIAGSSWLTTCTGGPAAVLDTALGLAVPADDDRPDLAPLGWEVVSRATVMSYQAALGRQSADQRPG